MRGLARRRCPGRPEVGARMARLCTIVPLLRTVSTPPVSTRRPRGRWRTRTGRPRPVRRRGRRRPRRAGRTRCRRSRRDGEHREPEDEKGPTVAAQAVALELTLEVVEARWIVDRFRHGVRFSGVAEPVSGPSVAGARDHSPERATATGTRGGARRRAGQLPGPLPDPPGGVPCQFSAGVRRRWMIPRTTSTTIAAAAMKANVAAMPAMRPIVDQANVESSRPRSVSPLNTVSRGG